MGHTLAYNPQKAIGRVIKARQKRGANKSSLLQYLDHLLVVWKNYPGITGYIKKQKSRLGRERKEGEAR